MEKKKKPLILILDKTKTGLHNISYQDITAVLILAVAVPGPAWVKMFDLQNINRCFLSFI